MSSGYNVDPGRQADWENSLNRLGEVSEYSYMSRLLIFMYEDPKKPCDSPEKYTVNLKFSPGVDGGHHHGDVMIPLFPEVSFEHITSFLQQMTYISPSTDELSI